MTIEDIEYVAKYHAYRMYAGDINDVNISIESFISGAKYVDNQPNYPWISVKEDLPCNHEELLDPISGYTKTNIVLTVCDNIYFINWMRMDNDGKWIWNSGKNITHWMILPELPQK